MPTNLPFPEPILEDVARCFRQLGEPMRLRLLQALEGGERGVGDLAQQMGSSAANVSRHLQALHDCGLIARRREGTSVYYRIEDPTVFQLCGLVCSSVEKKLKRRLG
ncbi:MAG: metalloregulator ArsR/SmtB family transcription factor [Bryobacteraceae bacterium]|nr:metalloregulator ArsR/SmtB family transcription factor [Bryobacteraceae bacterium]